jgi:predicted enzyme related to lactoylglutathione lyase
LIGSRLSTETSTGKLFLSIIKLILQQTFDHCAEIGDYMTAESVKKTGSIDWVDLTVKDAAEVRNFYQEVVGWQAAEVNMGSYNDYCMNEPATGKPIAGICHASGVNADIPPVWLIYITVEDLEKSAAKCVELGGQVIADPRQAGQHGRFCVIRDTAGAVVGLFEYLK